MVPLPSNTKSSIYSMTLPQKKTTLKLKRASFISILKATTDQYR